MNCIKKNIPNAITCINVLSGVMAIILGSKGNETIGAFSGIEWGYIFIAIASVADFLDGFMARLLKAYSDMGKELDSLCDAVSFGVAPAILLFYSLPDSMLKWWALVIPVAGVLRLARFNVDTRQTVNFIGLPIPANAIFWIGYTALLSQGCSLLGEWYIAVPVILVESWLMLSPLPLFSLKFKSWGWKGNAFRWILIVAAPLLVIIFGIPGLMWLIITYIILGILSASTTTK